MALSFLLLLQLILFVVLIDLALVIIVCKLLLAHIVTMWKTQVNSNIRRSFSFNMRILLAANPLDWTAMRWLAANERGRVRVKKDILLCL